MFLKDHLHFCQACNKIFNHRYDSKNLYCSKPCADIGISKGNAERAKSKQKEKESEYNKNPKMCKYCNSVIKYTTKWTPKFCSHKCSAKFHNKQKNLIRIYKTKKERPQKLFCNVYFKTCVICNNLFTVSGIGHGKSRCKPCQLFNKREYKKLCRFNFCREKYPELFNSKLIKKYGWFTPPSVKNPNFNGVSWDHLYPIHIGFANNVPPEIMRHPANAELVPFTENIRRYQKEKYTITLDNLYERIKLWDSGERNLPKFYSE